MCSSVPDPVAPLCFPTMCSYLVSTFESGLGRFAPRLHGLDEDTEASLAASLHAEVERRLPGRLLQGDLPPLGLGGAGDVQQPQVALHFLTGRRK